MGIERDEVRHCVEVSSGLQVPGTLRLATDSLTATLFTDNEDYRPRRDEPFYLRAETGEVVSLHNCYVSGPHTSYGVGQPPERVHAWSVQANCALVGWDRWLPTDRVRHVTFRVKGAEEMFWNKDAVHNLDLRNPTRGPLLQLTEGGLTVTVWYGGVYGIDFDTPREYWPMIDLDYDDGVSLDDYMEDAMAIVELLSLNLWQPLLPSELRISRIPAEEQTARLEAGQHYDEHRAEYVWPSLERAEDNPGPGRLTLLAHSAADVATLSASLAVTLRRREAWRNANKLMMGCLTRTHDVTAERLIGACRWLEEIPGARAAAGLPDGVRDALVRTAAAKAEDLGYPGLRQRIAGALRMLRAESHTERFTRLLADLGRVFGPMRLGERAEEYLKKAYTLRGKAAHGHFPLPTSQDFRDAYNACAAVEALCVLLTFADLPLDRGARDRASGHSTLNAFHMAYK